MSYNTPVRSISGLRTAAALLIPCLALGAGCTKKSDSQQVNSTTDGATAATTRVRPPAPPSVEIWRTLSKLDPAAKKPPEDVTALVGKTVKVAGFVIANEYDAADELTEFLITPVSGGCVHVPPPPPNYIMHIKMAAGKKAKMFMGPVEVEGTLALPKKAKDRDAFSFEMEAQTVNEFKRPRQEGT